MKPTGSIKKNGSNLTITIVENDSVIAIDIKNNLEGSGYTVAGVFCTGEDAVANIPEIEPDLIVMDIYLNGVIDGIEAAERIMLTHNIPVVFIAGQKDKIIIPRIYFTENYGILLKPFSGNELLNTIELVYNNYIRSIDFYLECKELIQGTNPYCIGFVENIDELINKLVNSPEVNNLKQVANLLNELKEHFHPLINADKTNFYLNQEFQRSIHSIIGYADHLLNEIDNLDEEEIKNYIAKICIYLKVVFAADLNSQG